MLKLLSAAVFVLGFTAIGAAMSMAQDSLVVELVAPRALRSGDSLEIQMTTAPLPQGARLLVKSERGEILGVITPFGAPGSDNTATIPVPRSALIGGNLRLHLQIVRPGAPPRPPSADQVRVKLLITSGG